MKSSFNKLLHELKNLANGFDETTIREKEIILRQLQNLHYKQNAQFINYHELLIFMCAYPGSNGLWTLAGKELNRITHFIKNSKHAKIKLPEGQGLPFTNTVTQFSPDFLKWLIQQREIKVEFDSFYKPSLELNEVLNLTLPSLLKAETTAGLHNDELLKALSVKPQHRVPFLISQIERLKEYPLAKDLLFEHLSLYVILTPKNKSFSRAFNRFLVAKPYFHNSLLKQFDQSELLNTVLPRETVLNSTQKEQTIKVIRFSMALRARETDPITYLDKNSFKFFELERGISVALFGMVPERQLPLESYVGFTLFKNGFPCAYGGSWIFGPRARFGMNIFESFRGGESGYIMCQLLRLYKQVFQINCFEIEPYQYGLDNPDGIKTGAFWFYYRYGFRPEKKELNKLAREEFRKIKYHKGYRCPERTLMRFTESNLVLNLGKSNTTQVSDITQKVKTLIEKNYKNDASKAEQESVKQFLQITGSGMPYEKQEQQTLTEVALWAKACKITGKNKLQQMSRMVNTKATNPYEYQHILCQFLS